MAQRVGCEMAKLFSFRFLYPFGFLFHVFLDGHMRQRPTIVTFMAPNTPLFNPVLLDKCLMTLGTHKHPPHIMNLPLLLHALPPSGTLIVLVKGSRKNNFPCLSVDSSRRAAWLVLSIRGVCTVLAPCQTDVSAPKQGKLFLRES